MSVLRVPEDVNIRDENIILDAQLTEVLDAKKIFVKNAKLLGGENDYLTQYFGTVNGVFRIWPGRETSKNDDGTYKSYDPRYRPWLSYTVMFFLFRGVADVLLPVISTGFIDFFGFPHIIPSEKKKPRRPFCTLSLLC